MNTDISADFLFESKYMDVKGSKMHYIDEGDGDPSLSSWQPYLQLPLAQRDAPFERTGTFDCARFDRDGKIG